MTENEDAAGRTDSDTALSPAQVTPTQPSANPTPPPPPAATAPPGSEPKQADQATVPADAEPVFAHALPLDPKPAEPEAAIRWTASEFITHQKSLGWYLMLAVAAIVLAAIVYVLTKGILSVVVIIAGALILGVYAAREPRQIEYQLDHTGIQIGQRHYPYHAYRSFSVVPEGAFSSIIFMPLRWFEPLTTIYYDPKDEDQIVDILAAALPMEEYKHDLLDRLINHLRF